MRERLVGASRPATGYEDRVTNMDRREFLWKRWPWVAQDDSIACQLMAALK